MEDFNVGDKVKYISSKYVDSPYNPLWGGEYGFVAGMITKITNDFLSKYYVRWDNGEKNVYRKSDLKHIPIQFPESLFKL